MNSKEKPILLLGDITGRSRVGVRMLTSALEARGHEVLALPTALISNTLGLGRHEVLDTTDYLLRTLRTWKTLGIDYGFLYIGYMTGLHQAQALCDVADEARSCGVKVLLDPILGDHGSMYHSVTPQQAQSMRLLAAHADIITPNLTEACLLTGFPYMQALEGGKSLQELLQKSAELAPHVLITSAHSTRGTYAVAVCEGEKQQLIPFVHVPGKHDGAGDLFSALLIHGLSQGAELCDAARAACTSVAQLIQKA